LFPHRRRHTTWPRDWSSDVCSSDLDPLDAEWRVGTDQQRAVDHVRCRRPVLAQFAMAGAGLGGLLPCLEMDAVLDRDPARRPDEIGRASCRWSGGWRGGGGVVWGEL